MRRALVLVITLGCAGSSAHGPAWPKPHEAEADGGESLAPHVSAQVAAIGLAKDDGDEVKPAVVTPVAAAGSAATPAPAAATTPTQTPTDETINTEEIIIEIDD